MGVCGVGGACNPQRQDEAVLVGMAVTLVAITALGIWYHLAQGEGPTTLPPIDVIKPPPIDVIKPPPIDVIKPPPIDVIKPPPIDEIKPPPIDEIKPPPIDPIPPSLLTKATQSLRESASTREALVAYLNAERATFGHLIVRDLGPNVVPWKSADWGKWMDKVMVETANQYHTRAHVLGALSDAHPMGALPTLLRAPSESWGKIKKALNAHITTTADLLGQLLRRLSPGERLQYDHLITFLEQQLQSLTDTSHLQAIADALGA